MYASLGFLAINKIPVATNQAIMNGDFYSKTETDQKLSTINTTITNHTNDKSNPHAVTASQVGAYSKQEIDTKLSKAVMADDSGKVTINDLVASSITLPNDTDGWVTLQKLHYKKTVIVCQEHYETVAKPLSHLFNKT